MREEGSRVCDQYRMRYYEDFFQPDPMADKCPFCKSSTCQNSPTVKERERSKVLQISRQKLSESLQSRSNKENNKEVGGKGLANPDNAAPIGLTSLGLRKKVAMRNTVKRLEDQINREIMESFALPVTMG